MTLNTLFNNIWILFPSCSELILENNNSTENELIGKVIYELAKYLTEKELQVTIITTHCSKQMQVLFDKGLTYFEKENFTARGSLFSRSFSRIIDYESTFYSGILDGFRLILFHGLSKETQEILSYSLLQKKFNSKLFLDKTVLLARIIKEYADYIGPIEFPDVMHFVSPLFIPAIITLKNVFSEVGKKVGVLFQETDAKQTVQIENLRKFLMEECLIDNTPHKIYNGSQENNTSVEEIIQQNKNANFTELGAIEANIVLTSGSNSALKGIDRNKIKKVDLEHIYNTKSYEKIVKLYYDLVRDIIS